MPAVLRAACIHKINVCTHEYTGKHVSVMNSWGPKIVIVWVVCSLVIAGGLMVTLSRPSAETRFPDPMNHTSEEQSLAGVIKIGPSPGLLFAMGGLGIMCVVVNEYQRRQRAVRHQRPGLNEQER